MTLVPKKKATQAVSTELTEDGGDPITVADPGGLWGVQPNPPLAHSLV